MDGRQIEADALRAFDEWLAGQSDDVRDMDILDQVQLYAADTQVSEAA